MAVAQNIESKETEALAAAVNLSICYFNCTDDEVGMTGLSVTLPYGDSEFYGYALSGFYRCGDGRRLCRLAGKIRLCRGL